MNENINSEIKEYHISRNIDVNNDDKSNVMENYENHDEIFSNYGIYKEKTDEYVCVGDINSTLMGGASSLYEEMSNLFDSSKTNYEARDISMLDYSQEELVHALKPSFSTDPIKLIKLDNNDYVINSNGRHRVTLLKANYISELQNCELPDSVAQINNKYLIPAQVHEIDKTKTYLNFILKQINKDKYIVENDIDSNFLKTDNVKLRIGDSVQIFSDDELLEFVQSEVSKYPSLFSDISKYCANSKSFSEFMEKNFSKITGYPNMENPQITK